MPQIRDRLLTLAVQLQRPDAPSGRDARIAMLTALEPDLQDQVQALLTAMTFLARGMPGDPRQLEAMVAAMERLPIEKVAPAVEVALFVGGEPPIAKRLRMFPALQPGAAHLQASNAVASAAE